MAILRAAAACHELRATVCRHGHAQTPIGEAGNPSPRICGSSHVASADDGAAVQCEAMSAPSLPPLPPRPPAPSIPPGGEAPPKRVVAFSVSFSPWERLLRAWQRYADWLAVQSWKRLAVLAVLALIVSGILSDLPPLSTRWFISDEKYTRVQTARQEALIRKPIKELVDELDPQQFWQIHRSTLVNAHAISAVTRDLRGRLRVSVRGHPQPLEVSRSYSGLFKSM